MKSGFTLVEMAMVLLILGLLTGSFIVPLGAQVDNNNLKTTDQQLSRIKEALLGYAIRNRQLPCPSSSATTGTQDATLCAQEGFLPWADLGMEGGDAWGNYFRYRADSKHSATGAYNTNIPTATDALEVANQAATIYVRNAVAILLSPGKNKKTDADNASLNQTYTQDNFVPNGFDDRLIWISDNELVSRLAAAGFRIK